jgi:hypothetical protein
MNQEPKSAAFRSGPPSRVTIDLEQLPQGQWYEDRYRGYLDIFQRIAQLPGVVEVRVLNAPWSWLPILHHLRCEIDSCRTVFEHCDMVRAAWTSHAPVNRTAIEVLASFRPECADVLWKIDMQWDMPWGRVRDYPPVGEFIVTTNGAYHRREVLDYMATLRNWRPRKKKVVLVPCAADKPYPAPMHSAVRAVMTDDWYMMNATGVVGLVPDALWDMMPHYDSGIPNQWRLFETVKHFFAINNHEQVVVYCDFYSETIHSAFAAIDQLDRVQFVLPVQPYYDYVDLMDPARLGALETAIQAANAGTRMLEL